VNIDNCTFSNNTSADGGGAMYLDDDSVTTIRNSTITGNNDTDDGGGIYADFDASLTVLHFLKKPRSGPDGPELDLA
jgi:predicted outer membrane repeat protein